jgi:hypothetical protein
MKEADKHKKKGTSFGIFGKDHSVVKVVTEVDDCNKL